MSINPHLSIATASIADVFAHLLEAQGHSGLYPDKQSGFGNAVFPHALCGTKEGGYRGTCPECIAVRKYRLDAGETNADQELRWNTLHARPGRVIKIGGK